MPRVIQRITDRQVKTVTKETSCGVVPGLIIVPKTRKDGTVVKHFVLKYQRDGKRKKFFLGAYPDLSLADAFIKAKLFRTKLDSGINPNEEAIAARREKVYGESISVEDLIWQYIDFQIARGKWSGKAADRQQDVWYGFLKNHFSEKLKKCSVTQLTPELLNEEFSELWQTHIDTPQRILKGIENAIAWGIRHKIIPPMSENPAQVKDGKLGDLLPAQRPSGTHMPALPVEQIPDFFVALANAIPLSQSARCLAFAILTAARNSTARESTWDEIILNSPKQGPYQLIPRARMKIKGEKLPFDRKTPLSKEAIGLLKTTPRMAKFGENDWIFVNIRNGSFNPISEDMLTKCIKDLHRRQKAIDGIGWVDPNEFNAGQPRRITPHGTARASFKTWANDASGYQHPEFKESTLESCLDHRHERYANAYDREQAFGDMKKVFDAWGKYCYSKLTQEQKRRLGMEC